MMEPSQPVRNDRAPIFAVTPKGDALRREILDAAAHGRPSWKVPTLDLRVPMLEGVAESVAPARWLGSFSRETILALETGHPYAVEIALENERVKDQLRRLAAAAIYDVCGRPYDGTDDSVCATLGYGDRRAAVRAVSAGRQLWPKLAAWPWWALNPTGGALDDEWWATPRVVETFWAWRDPDSWRAALGRS
jgi:hypothetical protein